MTQVEGTLAVDLLPRRKVSTVTPEVWHVILSYIKCGIVREDVCSMRKFSLPSPKENAPDSDMPQYVKEELNQEFDHLLERFCKPRTI